MIHAKTLHTQTITDSSASHTTAITARVARAKADAQGVLKSHLTLFPPRSIICSLAKARIHNAAVKESHNLHITVSFPDDNDRIKHEFTFNEISTNLEISSFISMFTITAHQKMNVTIDASGLEPEEVVSIVVDFVMEADAFTDVANQALLEADLTGDSCSLGVYGKPGAEMRFFTVWLTTDADDNAPPAQSA